MQAHTDYVQPAMQTDSRRIRVHMEWIPRSAMVRLCDDPAGRYHVKHMDRIVVAGTGECSSILLTLPMVLGSFVRLCFAYPSSLEVDGTE